MMDSDGGRSGDGGTAEGWIIESDKTRLEKQLSATTKEGNAGKDERPEEEKKTIDMKRRGQQTWYNGRAHLAREGLRD